MNIATIILFVLIAVVTVLTSYSVAWLVARREPKRFTLVFGGCVTTTWFLFVLWLIAELMK